MPFTRKTSKGLSCFACFLPCMCLFLRGSQVQCYFITKGTRCSSALKATGFVGFSKRQGAHFRSGLVFAGELESPARVCLKVRRNPMPSARPPAACTRHPQPQYLHVKCPLGELQGWLSGRTHVNSFTVAGVVTCGDCDCPSGRLSATGQTLLLRLLPWH